jgi:hypothetical protein
LGDTTVACSATDSHLNKTTDKSFVVSVLDTTKPVVTVPIRHHRGSELRRKARKSISR